MFPCMFYLLSNQQTIRFETLQVLLQIESWKLKHQTQHTMKIAIKLNKTGTAQQSLSSELATASYSQQQSEGTENLLLMKAD